MRRLSYLLLAAATLLVLTCPVAAQQSEPRTTLNPLVQLLESKGILTSQEAAMVSQATSPDEANARLAKLLLSKGLISQQEYDQTLAASVMPVSEASGARLVPAVLHVGKGAAENSSPGSPGGPTPSTPRVPEKPTVIPAITPLRVLPIDVPKPVKNVIPDLKLNNGALIVPFGFLKASAVYDSTNSGGATFGSNDFPLPLLLGDTGPDSGSQFHIKDRAARFGANFWWPTSENITLTGKIEADYEGDYTDVNNRNISSVRSSQLSIRQAWVRMDSKLGELPWFAEFGQNWTILGSTTQMDLFETTGNGIGLGQFWERMPQFRTGVQFHSGDFKLQPEFAITLPIFGEAGLSVDQRERFGTRVGSDSGQPGLQARVVAQFPLSHSWEGVAPAQIVISGGHARGREIALRGSLPDCKEAGPICTALPSGFKDNFDQNIWTAEISLPTPWITLVSKYYHGGDMRFFFAGQLNDVFPDVAGFAPSSAVEGAPCRDGSPAPGQFCNVTTLAGRAVPILNVNGTIVPGFLRPVRGQGGFVQVGFPLSRILHADPAGRNAGWMAYFGWGMDTALARDARRANGLARSDYFTASLRYKMNKWATFTNELSYYDTRTAEGIFKLFRGVDAHTAHDWRQEFGPVFTF